MTRTRYGIVTLIVGVLAVATTWAFFLRDDGDDTGSAPPGGDTSTTLAVAVQGSRPDLRNTGSDWDAIVRSIQDFSNWTYQHPDPKWAASTIHKHCDCYQVTERGLASLAAGGRRHTGAQLKVNEVTLREQLGPDEVRLYIVNEGVPGDRIVDADGKVVQEVPVLKPTGFLETLVRGADGRWLRYDSVCLGAPWRGWWLWEMTSACHRDRSSVVR